MESMKDWIGYLIDWKGEFIVHLLIEITNMRFRDRKVEQIPTAEIRKGISLEEVKKLDIAPNKAPILEPSMSSSNSLPPSNNNSLPPSVANKAPAPPTSVPSSPADSLSDDEFLAALEDCSLQTWDHKSHLRIAFLYLTRFGRREGVKVGFNHSTHLLHT